MWDGKNIRFKYHLENWETITQPIIYGVWGINNIFDFGKDLAAKIL